MPLHDTDGLAWDSAGARVVVHATAAAKGGSAGGMMRHTLYVERDGTGAFRAEQLPFGRLHGPGQITGIPARGFAAGQPQALPPFGRRRCEAVEVGWGGPVPIPPA